MNIKAENALALCSKSTFEEIKEAIQSIKQPIEDECNEFTAKCNRYSATKDERFKKITAQIAKIEEQKAAVQAKYDALKRSLVQATLSGDQAQLQKVQGGMSQCESDMAAFDAQIEALRGHVVSGDPQMFNEIKASYAVLHEHIEAMNEVLRNVANAAAEIRNGWKSAAEMAQESVIKESGTFWATPNGGLSGKVINPFDDAFKRAEKVHGSSETVGEILQRDAAATQRRASVPNTNGIDIFKQDINPMSIVPKSNKVYCTGSPAPEW